MTSPPNQTTTPEKRVDEIVAGLTVAQRMVLRIATGDHAAGDFGWVSSNTTVRMRAMNRKGVLIEREYRGGRNVYRLTPLGLAVRTAILSNKDADK